jgi:hypothetical protein
MVQAVKFDSELERWVDGYYLSDQSRAGWQVALTQLAAASFAQPCLA